MFHCMSIKSKHITLTCEQPPIRKQLELQSQCEVTIEHDPQTLHSSPKLSNTFKGRRGQTFGKYRSVGSHNLGSPDTFPATPLVGLVRLFYHDGDIKSCVNVPTGSSVTLG